MSTMMIHDVTATAQTESTSVVQKKKTTITPFQKILDKENEVYASSEAQTEKTETETAVKTSSVSKSRTISSSKSGETTLQDIFERAAQKYDVSYDFLVAVAKAESDFNTKCVSSAGAQGIMQVMPEEQKGLGIKDPFDAEQNIMGAAKLLKAHLKKFNGDYTLAAAAYNAGSGAVKKYGGVPPYKETQNYVKKIKKYMEEGVTVPDKKVATSSQDSTVGSGASAGATTETKESTTNTVEAKAATSADLEKVTVAIGTGESTITMTYGAYLKYLEMGSTGVG
ncbi:MAG: lytic transglycosylase domain-containing protein [Eubacterium sp.]|nr:lytic transglycosylase domain-containing protein [Eubacterium sp.]